MNVFMVKAAASDQLRSKGLCSDGFPQMASVSSDGTVRICDIPSAALLRQCDMNGRHMFRLHRVLNHAATKESLVFFSTKSLDLSTHRRGDEEIRIPLPCVSIQALDSFSSSSTNDELPNTDSERGYHRVFAYGGNAGLVRIHASFLPSFTKKQPQNLPSSSQHNNNSGHEVTVSDETLLQLIRNEISNNDLDGIGSADDNQDHEDSVIIEEGEVTGDKSGKRNTHRRLQTSSSAKKNVLLI